MNKLNNKNSILNNMKIILFFLLSSSAITAVAQERVPLSDSKPYFLKKVNVTGKISYNEQTVTTFAGLEKGQKIYVPGEEISNAIKKLWKLGLFSDVDFYIDTIEGDSITLELNINELPKLKEVKFVGIKKGKVEALIKDNGLKPEKIVTENLLTTTKNYIENKYKKDGYYNTKVLITTTPDQDTLKANHVNMLVRIDKGEKIKVREINVTGNKVLSDATILKNIKNTKTKKIYRFWKASKYIKEKYKEDLKNVVEKYKEKGFSYSCCS